jgi:transposase
VLIDAVIHQRIDMLPNRKAATLTAWLREHPGAEIVCRDGTAAYAEAIRQGAPEAVQASDRWQCAMKRLVVFPAQSGRTQREVLGSDGLPGSER